MWSAGRLLPLPRHRTSQPMHARHISTRGHATRPPRRRTTPLDPPPWRAPREPPGPVIRGLSYCFWKRPPPRLSIGWACGGGKIAAVRKIRPSVLVRHRPMQRGSREGIAGFSLSLPWPDTSVLTSGWLFTFCWLIAGDLEGLLTQARATRHGLRTSPRRLISSSWVMPNRARKRFYSTGSGSTRCASSASSGSAAIRRISATHCRATCIVHQPLSR
jgi:hypothetical protein